MAQRTSRRRLLVVGARAVGGRSPGLGWLAAQYKLNVLVLDDDWYDSRLALTDRPLALGPKYLAGALGKEPLPQWHRRPASPSGACVANRCTWLAGPEHPLVEEIRSSQRGLEPLRTVVSYVPWPQQLGRAEAVDGLLLELMSETAKLRPAAIGRSLAAAVSGRPRRHAARASGVGRRVEGRGQRGRRRRIVPAGRLCVGSAARRASRFLRRRSRPQDRPGVHRPGRRC